jgi:hypothetical protein
MRPEYFLFHSLPLVPGGSAAPGPWVGNGALPPAGKQTVQRVRLPFPARLQPGEILSGVRRPYEAETRRRAQTETKAGMSRFRNGKSLVNQALLERVGG